MNDKSEKKARPLGINHVVLEVDDLDRALEFYGALFDFTLRGRGDHNAF
ncbi:MAG TPA: VOC family protein, partial [Candidatus Binatia bacterium]